MIENEGKIGRAVAAAVSMNDDSNDELDVVDVDDHRW